jgi:YesN/AraC family two-component response regulator
VTCRVVIADDVAAIRQLLRTLLALDDMEVVGEARNGAEAVELATEHRPDVVILDIAMPGMDGVQAIPQILEASPDTKIVMVSAFATPAVRERAFELGVEAFLDKAAIVDEVVGAVRRAGRLSE